MDRLKELWLQNSESDLPRDNRFEDWNLSVPVSVSEDVVRQATAENDECKRER